MSDMEAYAQSKLAITAWSLAMEREFKGGLSIVAVNPDHYLQRKWLRRGLGSKEMTSTLALTYWLGL